MSGDQSKPHQPHAAGPAETAHSKSAAAAVKSGTATAAGQGKAAGSPSVMTEVVVVPMEADTSGAALAMHHDPAVDWSSPRYLWQGPTILISAVLIVIGLYVGAKPAKTNDFEGALSQIEQWIDAGELDRAAGQLRVVVEPNLSLATPTQKARFEAAVADYLSLVIKAKALDDPEVLRRAAKHYSAAFELGLPLTPLRLERWANGLIGSGQLKEAQIRVADLDRRRAAEKDSGSAELLGEVRTRVFRRLIDAMLTRREYVHDDLMRLLADFRLDRGISASDEFWAIARQTELRLQQGEARQAVDVLLVEMRRLENRTLPGEAASSAVGELYTLLGRAYFELGEYARAKSHLEYALTLFTGPETARGDALAMLGQIALSTAQPDAALEHFQLVVRDFITAPSYLPALLGRAEVFSILGEHEASMNDYTLLASSMELSKGWPDAGTNQWYITPHRVSESLSDRHDAALALGKLHRALDYIELAESLFDPDHVPADVLFRLAATNRQIADDLLASAAGSLPTEDSNVIVDLDPAIRREANIRYERAGEVFLRHYNADLSDLGSPGDEAAASLWLAADCFDLGGRQNLAIVNFTKYLDMQPIDDARRAQTLYRLASACQAVDDLENAVRHYEQLVSDRSRSTYAAEAYVPLARCYVSTNRASEARQLLQQVLSGNRLLQPDAKHYREALLELGRIEYAANSYVPAIEAFEEFLQRYSDDARAAEARYLLADSYRSNAVTIGERIDQDAGMSPTEVGRLNAIRNEQLSTAMELFALVSEQAAARVEPHNTQGSGTNGPGAANRAAAYQRDLVRRASLYRADCAFQLGQFALAVDLYDHAARQYSDHHSSMYALIQIVNAYNALGDAERAAAAHQRALVRLKQLPEDAFRVGDSLMDRSAWERWLENNPVNPSHTASVSAPTG